MMALFAQYKVNMPAPTISAQTKKANAATLGTAPRPRKYFAEIAASVIDWRPFGRDYCRAELKFWFTRSAGRESADRCAVFEGESCANARF
jgi:hypothetical protein